MKAEYSETLDEEAFHLPFTGLFADVDVGSGCVRLTDDFEDCDLLTRLRIVQDWQRDLQALRHSTLARLFRTRFERLSVSRAEQIERFNRYCEQHGVECPQGLAASLLEGAEWGCTSTTH